MREKKSFLLLFSFPLPSPLKITKLGRLIANQAATHSFSFYELLLHQRQQLLQRDLDFETTHSPCYNTITLRGISLHWHGFHFTSCLVSTVNRTFPVKPLPLNLTLGFSAYFVCPSISKLRKNSKISFCSM